MKKALNKKKLITVCIVLTAAVLIIAECVRSSNCLEITHYSLQSDKLDTSLHFVLIADLHNKEFGENNTGLIKAIENENPQFVCVAGDMVIRNYADDSVMKAFLAQLAKNTPVYCCMGNHERDLQNVMDFKADIDGTGALLLDNEISYLEIGGEEIVIGGLSDYPYCGGYPGGHQSEESKFLEKFFAQSDERYSILLFHQPEYFTSLTADNDIDLILSGHTHGGLIRLPIVGGIIAPSQGLFPEYDKGLFTEKNTNIIITSGLGVSNPIPRFNNPPEICVIDVN